MMKTKLGLWSLLLLFLALVAVTGVAIAEESADDGERPSQEEQRPVPADKERLMELASQQVYSCPCPSGPPCTVTVHDVCGACESAACPSFGFLFKADIIVDFDASCNMTNATTSACWRICGTC